MSDQPACSIPLRDVEVEDSELAPDDPQLALIFSGIYGWATLTRGQLQAMRPALEKEYDKYAEDDELPPGKSLRLEELTDSLSGAPFWQEPPEYPCPDANCSNHAVEGALQVFLLLRDSKLGSGVTLANYIGDCTRLIFLKCPACHAVVATHEGT